MDTIGFIGLGLIGGSIAKGIRRHYPNYTLIGYDYSYESVEQAKEDGTLTIGVKEIGEEFLTCDIIYLCMPVSVNIAYLQKIKPFLKDTCILTDVGSVKAPIHEEILSLKMENQFIGGHPMAGSEKTGYENATDHLVENAYYALTPSSHTQEESLIKLKELTSSIGALPIILEPKEHDYIVATISHLPHIIASSLVNIVKQSENNGIMKDMAAGGFKDITRIASASPLIWQQICLTNKEHIVKAMEVFIEYLKSIKESLAGSDSHKIFNFFEESRNYRDSIPNNRIGPISNTYHIYCDLIDEAGSIAKAATILANQSISIKNIGIIHTRGYQEEVLRIEFYDAKSSDLAADILLKHNYTVTKP